MGQEILREYGGAVESRILQELERRGSCPLDEFVRAFPEYAWRQVFAAVDRLSRSGTLILRKPTPFQYVVAIGCSTHATRHC